MNKFKVGDTFTKTSIFTGGSHDCTIVSRTETELKVAATYHELDGIHKVEETYQIYTNKNGEYIILWEYKGYRGIYEAKETEPEENDFPEDDPCYGCQAFDGSYNCKHCPYGDDGNYSVYDVYTPAELGINVKW